ncbi:tRNA (guanine-N(7)-)-methyltransferase (tRNA(m7G46)-methyltransferase) [Zalaria obscura]|uniref:tRNA (Guanine-N(7)-)-methyltransferase (tRNA(m7G46)-methyltransferase) n=1 Tax=Zalaria obscura TaxID=2024903 RepID=A0ACC3S5F0_9PEZI
MGLGSRDVAIACIGAFLSWTLLTHLLPSLRWIPYAFLAGVLATALGLLYVLLTTSRGVHYGRKRRRQYVPPAFLRPGQWQQEKEDLKARSSYQKTAIFPRSKKVSRSIDTLLDLIVRDFVTGWTMTESEELDLAIAGKYKDGRLHKAADLTFSDTKLMQQAHLRKTTARLLPYVLSESMQTSPAVTTLVREIVACAVLGPIMQMLTDPDMWNQLLEGYGRTLLQDRKTVRKLRAALDERAPASPANAKPAQFPRLRPGDNERQFERFIRAIRHCSTLSDARRFRSEITSQIRRASSVEVQDPVYQRRLEAGRRILDQKIAYLAAGGTSKPKLRLRPTTTASEVSAKLQQATLKEVMHNASGLSYFMESLDYTRDSSPKLSRTNSSGARVRVKEPELRRTVMSSTDLNASARPTLSPSTSRASLDLSRKSFDDSGVRPALFDDDIDDERLTRSVPTLGTESDGELDADVQEVNTHVVNDMQTALNKIMADEPDKDSLFASEPSIRSSTFNDSPRNSVDLLRPPMLHQKSKPSIASLGLVGAPSSTGVFTDDLFGDEEKFLEDEREDADINEKAPEDDIHEAAPGDLGLAEAIDALNAEIQRLTAQEAIVDSLTKKAELTNNAAELRILKKSKQSLQREIHRKKMQKQQQGRGWP